jgi:hypothetical protein
MTCDLIFLESVYTAHSVYTDTHEPYVALSRLAIFPITNTNSKSIKNTIVSRPSRLVLLLTQKNGIEESALGRG